MESASALFSLSQLLDDEPPSAPPSCFEISVAPPRRSSTAVTGDKTRRKSPRLHQHNPTPQAVFLDPTGKVRECTFRKGNCSAGVGGPPDVLQSKAEGGKHSTRKFLPEGRVSRLLCRLAFAGTLWMCTSIKRSLCARGGEALASSHGGDGCSCGGRGYGGRESVLDAIPCESRFQRRLYALAEEGGRGTARGSRFCVCLQNSGSQTNSLGAGAQHASLKLFSSALPQGALGKALQRDRIFGHFLGSILAERGLLFSDEAVKRESRLLSRGICAGKRNGGERRERQRGRVGRRREGGLCSLQPLCTPRPKRLTGDCLCTNKLTRRGSRMEKERGRGDLSPCGEALAEFPGNPTPSPLQTRRNPHFARPQSRPPRGLHSRRTLHSRSRSPSSSPRKSKSPHRRSPLSASAKGAFRLAFDGKVHKGFKEEVTGRRRGRPRV